MDNIVHFWLHRRTMLSICVTSKGTIKSGHFMVKSGHFDLFYGQKWFRLCNQKWTTLSVCVTKTNNYDKFNFFCSVNLEHNLSIFIKAN